MLLVAPDGRRALLLGHAGGANSFNGLLDAGRRAVRRDSGRRPRAGTQPGPAVRLRVPCRPTLTSAGPDRRHGPLDVRRQHWLEASGASTSTTTTARPSRSTAGHSSCELVPTPYPSAAGRRRRSGRCGGHRRRRQPAPDDRPAPTTPILLLVGPQGQHTVLMSDVGGDNDPVAHVAITLDDEAPSLLPGRRPDRGRLLPADRLRNPWERRLTRRPRRHQRARPR